MMFCSICRKRLVESSANGKLYIVCRSMQCLRVFELSNGNHCSRQWVEVRSFGDDDDEQVLFLSKSYCFFAAAAEFPGCQLRNCIIFSHDAFTLKFRDDWRSKVLNVEEEPRIHQLGSTEASSQYHISRIIPSSLTACSGGPTESDEMLPSTSNLEGDTLQTHTQKSSAPLSGPISRKGTTEIVSISSAQEKTTGNSSSNCEAREETMKILSSTEDVEHVIEQECSKDGEELDSTRMIMDQQNVGASLRKKMKNNMKRGCLKIKVGGDSAESNSVYANKKKKEKSAFVMKKHINNSDYWVNLVEHIRV